MVYNDEDICVSDMVRCPENRTLSLSNYLMLSQMHPEGNKTPPLLNKRERVSGAVLRDYWFSKLPLFGNSVYVQFDEETRRILRSQHIYADRTSDETIITFPTEEEVKVVGQTFRKPFRFTKREKEIGTELRKFYRDLFSTLKGEEVDFVGHKTQRGYFVEAVKVPQGLEDITPAKGWVQL